MSRCRHNYRCAMTLCLLASFSFTLRAAETPPPSAEQLQAWIKQLGSDEFQKREEARAALVKMGQAAAGALKAAQATDDPEVKRAIGAILGQLQWQDLGAKKDYLDLFPADSIFVLKLKGLATSASGARKTAIGKLMDSPDFKPLVDLITKRVEPQWQMLDAMLAAMQTNAPANTQGPTTGALLRTFGGQIAASVWKFNPMAMMGGNPDDAFGLAAIAELQGDDPMGVYKQILAASGIGDGAEEVRYEGLSILTQQAGQGAITLAGRHLILAPNAGSIKQVADALLKSTETRLTLSPAFQKLKPHLAGEPDLALYLNFQAYMKAVAAMGPGLAPLLNQMGYDSLEFFAMTTSIVGDRFEDRFVTVTSGKATGFMKLAEGVYSSTTPLKEILAVAPPDAVVVGNMYLDGQGTSEFLIEYLKTLAQLQAQMGLPGKDIAAEQEKLEKKLGLKLSDLAGAIKGDAVYWVTLAKDLTPPDAGLALGCADAEKAKLLAENLGKLLDGAAAMAKEDLKLGGELNPTSMKVEKDGRTLFTEAENSPLVTVPGRAMLPYRLSWAATGTRVLISTSQVALQKRLLALDNHAPGFDPARALEPGQPDPKGLLAVDLRAMLNYGSKFGLPLMALQMGSDPEVMGLLNTLAAKEDLFQGMPFITVSAQAPKDGVSVAVMRSPLPYLPTVAAVVAAAVALPRAAAKARAAGPGAKGF